MRGRGILVKLRLRYEDRGMDTTPTFDLFGAAHWGLLAGCAALGFLIVCGTRRWATPRQAYRVGCLVAVYTVLQEFVDRSGHYVWNHEPLTHVLPLHLCGVSVFAVPVMLVTRSFAIYEVMYFWGLGGATVALLTPEVPFGFPHLLCITFFTSHALIIVGVLFATVNYGFRPTWRSLRRTILFTLCYAGAMIPVNLLLGTNYLYICDKPKGISALDFMGPWPWYIPGLVALALTVFLLLYTPYAIHDARARRGRE